MLGDDLVGGQLSWTRKEPAASINQLTRYIEKLPTVPSIKKTLQLVTCAMHNTTPGSSRNYTALILLRCCCINFFLAFLSIVKFQNFQVQTTTVFKNDLVANSVAKKKENKRILDEHYLYS